MNDLVYVDPLIEETVNRLINEFLRSTNNKSPAGVRREAKLMRANYDSVFAQIKISDITIDFFDNLLVEGATDKFYCALRLLFSLTSEEQIKDKELKKLRAFQNRIINAPFKFGKEEFDMIMHSSAYDLFVVDGELIISEKLFFTSLNDVDFYDTQIAEITNAFFANIKLEKSTPESNRYNKCLLLKNLAKSFFEANSIAKLSLATIADYLEENAATANVSLLADYLSHIKSCATLNEAVSRLESFLSTAPRRMNILKLATLCRNDKFDWCIWVKHKKENTGFRLFETDIPYHYPLFDDMRDFLSSGHHHGAGFTLFVAEFYKSLNNHSIKGAIDLSFQSFLDSIAYFEKYNNTSYYSYVTSFFGFCYQKHGIAFFSNEIVDPLIFYKAGLGQKLIEGFKIINYNPAEDVPHPDRWILCYNPDYNASTKIRLSETITVDFLRVNNLEFRSLVKSFYWHYPTSIRSRPTYLGAIIMFVNYIDALRTGKELSLYCTSKTPPSTIISLEELFAFKDYISSKGTSTLAQFNYANRVRAFLHFLADFMGFEIPLSVFYHLYVRHVDHNTALAIPQDHLESLSKLIIKNAAQSTEDATTRIKRDLYANVFFFLLETELRVSHVLGLTADCVHETAKKGEYVVLTKNKDQTNQLIEIAITPYTKRRIDHILSITKDLRAKACEALKNVLFLTPRKGTLEVSRVDDGAFANYLRKCCDELNLPMYTPQNLRDTHMTMAREYKLQKDLSELDHSVLTGHKTPGMDIAHYVNIPLKSILEALHGIIIGDITLLGDVVQSIPAHINSAAHEVSHGCGFCQSTACDDFTYLDCVMCKHFVTMPSRLPYFKEQIADIDAKIKTANIPHDKEDLVNIKRLLVAYVYEINEFIAKGGKA